MRRAASSPLPVPSALRVLPVALAALLLGAPPASTTAPPSLGEPRKEPREEPLEWPLEPPLEWPLDEPVAERGLVSSFGEDRGNHFHGGVDMTTRGRVGVPVVAARDGEVYRVKVKWRGLGRAIYLRHDDGLITVAGHLAGFAEPIRSWVDDQLEARRPYPGDLWPPEPFRVERGQVIAWSGKTGGGPPHLHFETRRGNGSIPVDPFAEGLPCPDGDPPRIEAIWTPKPPSSGRHDPSPVSLPADAPVTVETAARVAVRVQDPMGVGTGALRRLRVTLDGTVLIDLDLDRFAYSRTHLAPFVYVRESAATGDDGAWLWAGDLPGNTLPFVSGREGIDPVAEQREARLEIVAEDGCGNVARERVPLRLVPAAPAPAAGELVEVGGGQVSTASARLDVPPGALGEPVGFRIVAPDEAVAPPPGGLRLVTGPVVVEPAWLPLRKKAIIRFAEPAPDDSHGVYRWDRGASAWSFWGDDRRGGGRLGTTTDRLGAFALLADESPPRVHSVERVRATGRPWTADADEIRVRYEELGEGVGWDGARLRIATPGEGSSELVADNDPDAGELVFIVPEELAGHTTEGTLTVRDGAGNETVREISLPPPAP